MVNNFAFAQYRRRRLFHNLAVVEICLHRMQQTNHIAVSQRVFLFVDHFLAIETASVVSGVARRNTFAVHVYAYHEVNILYLVGMTRRRCNQVAANRFAHDGALRQVMYVYCATGGAVSWNQSQFHFNYVDPI